ncbi:hypothetical protein [Okeania sp. SIO3I5]|nr:hypothetical protein [Okeania sp. SIO3I5]
MSVISYQLTVNSKFVSSIKNCHELSDLPTGRLLFRQQHLLC